MYTNPGRVQLALCLALSLCGCAGFQAVNEPLEKVEPGRGYRQFSKPIAAGAGEIWLSLAFSGGGTRAAAFAYGVLEELRDTEIRVNGRSIRLLDEVDTISAVSGGTFPAVYYGLFGDRIFDDFESKFLNQNIQRALFFRAMRPWNLVRLMSPSFSRSLLAMEYYNRNVFDGSTFADLQEKMEAAQALAEIHVAKAKYYKPPDHLDMIYGYVERHRGSVPHAAAVGGTESEGPAGGHESSPCAHGELSWSAEGPLGGQECAPCAHGELRAFAKFIKNK